jgi:hypothetical protein
VKETVRHVGFLLVIAGGITAVAAWGLGQQPYRGVVLVLAAWLMIIGVFKIATGGRR